MEKKLLSDLIRIAYDGDVERCIRNLRQRLKTKPLPVGEFKKTLEEDLKLA